MSPLWFKSDNKTREVMKIQQILFVMVLMTALSCASDGDRIPFPPVEVTFTLLNESGEETTSFRQGEDIVFDYRIINYSDEPVTWYFDSLFNYRNLFTVFRKATPNAELSDEGRVKKGSPHTSVLQRDFRWGRVIPGKGEMTIRMSWMGDMDKTHMFDNWQIEYHKRDLLPAGDYFVEFDQEIDFALYKNLNTKFKIDFEID